MDVVASGSRVQLGVVMCCRRLVWGQRSSSGPVGVPKDLHAASVVVGIDAEEMKGEDDERSARGGSK